MKSETKRVPRTSRKYKIGDHVYGVRCPVAESGIIVDMYCTINESWSGTYRNPAYVIKCDRDGKERVFQTVRFLNAAPLPEYFTIR